MPLSKEEKETLEKLMAKDKEPAGPPANVNFNLDLSSDSAWERAKQLGIVRDPEPADPKEGEESDDPPKRRGYFGNE